MFLSIELYVLFIYLGQSPLKDVSFANIFFLVSCWSYHLMKSRLLIVSLVELFIWCWIFTIYPSSPVFSSKCHLPGNFTFGFHTKVGIYFVLIFSAGVRSVSRDSFFVHIDAQLLQYQFVEKKLLVLLYFLLCQRSVDYIHMGPISKFYFLSTYLYILSSVLHYIDYYSFIIRPLFKKSGYLVSWCCYVAFIHFEYKWFRSIVSLSVDWLLFCWYFFLLLCRMFVLFCF